MPDLHATLSRCFGYDTFRPGQEQVIHALLEGRSSLAIFPTGGGKSLCYQLPALLLDGVTLVISPLIALMKDQVEALRARGVSAARLDSSLTANEVTEVFDAMRNGTLKLLYIAPERLMNESFMERLGRLKIGLLAIDEAHCISEWGHNFRPEYLRLAAVARRLKLHPVLTLTATATPSVAADIRRGFAIEERDLVQTPFHRSNLNLHITPVEIGKRLDLLTKKLLKFKRIPAIVYVTLQETAEHVATHLGKAGLNAASYHAGLTAERRAEVQERFMSGEVDIIVATIAFGMGIDKADIRAVYHYNLPKSLENYQQEIGRAGRDGKPSHCEMLACADDLIVLQNFVFGDTPTPQALRQLLDHLLRQGMEFDLSHYDISRTVDIRPLVLETVMTYLELDGVLAPLGAFYTGYQFQFLQTEPRVLAGHKPERQAFLKKMFEACKRGY
ncbi:MAG: RecQ family ATP-dependent DNA helicase, partial [Verrucomicrobiaceae bacterium]